MIEPFQKYVSHEGSFQKFPARFNCMFSISKHWKLDVGYLIQSLVILSHSLNDLCGLDRDTFFTPAPLSNTSRSQFRTSQISMLDKLFYFLKPSCILYWNPLSYERDSFFSRIIENFHR